VNVAQENKMLWDLPPLRSMNASDKIVGSTVLLTTGKDMHISRLPRPGLRC